MKEPTIKELASEFNKTRQNMRNLKKRKSPMFIVYVKAWKFEQVKKYVNVEEVSS